MSVENSYSPQINTKKVILGIVIATLIIIGAIYGFTRPKENSVGSSNQITQPNTSSPVVAPNLVGFEKEFIIVTDTFYIKRDSTPAAIVYRDSTSDNIKQVLGHIITLNYYSKVGGMKLVQSIPTYYKGAKQIKGNLVITSNINP